MQRGSLQNIPPSATASSIVKTIQTHPIKDFNEPRQQSTVSSKENLTTPTESNEKQQQENETQKESKSVSVGVKSHGISSLSLASIQKKKEWEKQQKKEHVSEEQLPENPFDEETLIRYWKTYQKQKIEQKEQNIASLFQLDTPRLTAPNQIQYQVPSTLNKVELEREFVYFLPYLREALQNYSLTISIELGQNEEKNFVYTPEEKYNRLREINPEIDLLRKTLDLEL